MNSKVNILVVDDEQNITESLSGILTDEGYVVDTVMSGDDALANLQTQPYDLILLDIWLPGRKDGLQTLREIRKRGINSEVIMISGHGTIDTAVRATKLGAFDFIEKPLSLEHVLETVQAALTSRKKKGDKETVDGGYNYIALSEMMKSELKKIEPASKSSSPLLIVGESGTGKEFTALYIHQNSSRANEPFIKVGCEGLKVTEFERLFGPIDEDLNLKDSKISKLTGTVYLENPHALPQKLQKRLVELISVSGGSKKSKLAFIASTIETSDSKIKEMAKPLKSIFEAHTLYLPPLRKRKEDIKEFIEYFARHASEDFGKPDLVISEKAMNRMLSYPWPGNVRELQSAVENMIMASINKKIEPSDIPFGGYLGKADKEILKNSSADIDQNGKSRTAFLMQKTIKHSVVITGLGLHSGLKTGLIISPMPPNSGIIISDISSGKQAMASLDNVESTEYATTLKMGQTSVRTIEHLMATLHMYGITNALLKVGDEIPILDGSAAKFCELIEKAGTVYQNEIIEPIRVGENILVGELAEDKRYILIEPADTLSVEYRMDYPPPVGKMRARFKKNGLENFKNEIAPARTFGFIKDVKEFENKGLAEGGKLSNVILVDDEKIVNTALRFEDEFARHKVLDILGDFYLLGRPIIAKITANLSGHSMNIAALKKIRDLLEAESGK